MIKEFIAGLSLLALVQITPAKAESPLNQDTTKNIANEVVAIVGNSFILLSDVERVTGQVVEQRRQSGSLSEREPFSEAFESLLVQKLFATQARHDSLEKMLPDLTTDIEEYITGLVEQAGSVAALQKQFGKPIFAIKEDMTKEYKEMQLAQLMQSKVKGEVKINYQDVKDFFVTLPLDSLPLMPEQYIYSQITVVPPATEKRKFEIRQELLGYRERILAGEKLSTLARLYSMDPGTASKGGEWGPDDADKLTGQFVEALDGLKPGKVSEVFETEYGFHIAELISREGKIVHYRHMLLKPEFTVEEERRAMTFLDSLAQNVGKDKAAFEEAVYKHSEDKTTRQNQGLVYNILMATRNMSGRDATTKFVKEAIFPPADAYQLARLKVGEVSPPFVSTDIKYNQIYKIVRLDHVIPTHAANLEQDYEDIADVALQNKSNLEMDQWIVRNIPKTYVWLSPKYTDIKFDHNWKKQ